MNQEQLMVLQDYNLEVTITDTLKQLNNFELCIRIKFSFIEL